MAKNIRVRMNHSGARAILNSGEVQSNLLARAQAIQAGANATLPGDAAPYVADVQAGTNRARAMVKTSDAANRRHEGKTNAILKNLDRGAG